MARLLEPGGMGNDLRPDGLYEAIVNDDLRATLPGDAQITERALGAEESSRFLARHLEDYLRRALTAAPHAERPALVNHLIESLATHLDGFVQPGDRIEGRLLTSITRGPGAPPVRPDVPLSEAALFVNARGERSLGVELRKELASADRVDLICAFLFWTGYITLRDAIRDFCQRGGKLRVISTPYRGVTEPRVLQDLVDLGAELRVAYDSQTTRLHAKAWLFHRASGYSTAYVGSSNMSRSALQSGLEWNVRLSAIENRAVLGQFRAAFDSYWNDSEFEPYDAKRFAIARQDARGSSNPTTVLMLRPRPFQQAILEQLATARELHDRHRNLVVAATGTGKTVMAALDYARLCTPGRRPTLLFVAHRREILRQARDTFRHALTDGDFGELLGGGEEPVHWRYVFASVQSLTGRLASLPIDQFDHVIVDEFHHTGAPTWLAVLEHFKPTELLGLTATPERADGIDVLAYFGGRVAAEVRLWDAIDRGLLVPFQYFVLHDTVDLSDVSWRGGGYNAAMLDTLYTGHNRRAAIIAKAVHDHVGDPMQMRALGFCAGLNHAHYMAKEFSRVGIPAAVISGKTPKKDREALTRALLSEDNAAHPNRPRIIFTVDVFNEGIDLPAVDTILFLRPTDSATLFLQQLGRGLRRWAGKRCLTVLDFVGKARREFRFDRKLRAVTGQTRAGVRRQVEQGFPLLPAGCSMHLDRTSREVILDNLRQALGHHRRGLVAELRALNDPSLGAFLKATDLDLTDIYRTRSYADLRRAAGFTVPPAGPKEDTLARAICRLIHVDDPARIDAWLQAIDGEGPCKPAQTERTLRLRLMLSTALFQASAVGEDALAPLWDHPALLTELRALLRLRREQLDHQVLPFAHKAPLSVHAHYTLSEVMAAFGDVRNNALYKPREGVVFHA
ncbi:MAG: superfamily II DNA or RNA helicase, partial [Bradymonadia bacterium]